MKGTIINTDGIFEIKYEVLMPHAGVSKKGTGPGVGKKIYDTRTIIIENIANYKVGDEVEFYINNKKAII